MPTDHTEKGFEQAIEAHLLAHGYVKGSPAAFDARTAVDAGTLVAFLKATQPKEWGKLAAVYGNEVEAKVVGTVVKDLDSRGMLDCLRHGVKDRGVTLHLAYFKPATGLNPETLALYGQNVLTVTRQVHYSEKKPNLSVDVVLAVNGLPVATAELKNPFTGQNVWHAVKQYQDRDVKEPLLAFKKRALVHFAVDPDLVYMTTRLAGEDTFFLPFNKGRDGGKGNPDNSEGFKTAYLWEQVWERDAWLDIIARFVHLEVKEEKKGSKLVKKEGIIFPRYHQWDAVRRLVAAARTTGSGTNYLVQHSAGSGKSNTIAWLAHRLSNLHDEQDKPVFDSVIVITDRRVLDRQLQDTIYQFEHKQGVVLPIDEDSQQLADSLAAGGRIIITTLQKFSFVLDKIGGLPSRRYAVVADEAHSSQSGDSAANLKKVLSAQTLEAAEQQEAKIDPTENEVEAEIDKAIAARGPQKNLSFFAFTATPKHKTLELFGHDGPDGKPMPFHLYSMRQAIEEGFILDVLRNYTTYSTFYRLSKAVEDDPEVDRKKAVQAMAKFVSLHPHNLAQKAEVMVEHFRNVTRHKVGGRGKAMLVTRSRLHAVKYKQVVDKYLKEKGYVDTRALVAFSGTVEDENGVEHTEPQMNGFGEKELPARFESADYHLLIVAEKYQTGFDQPLLHTMYVDKKLDGLQAVQTLSRLNRTHPLKEDTFVLDFVNEAEEVREAFKPFYEATAVEQRVDPNLLYGLKHKLDGFQVYWQQEVDGFAAVFFKPADKQKESDKGLLHTFVDPAVGRFAQQDDEPRADFRHQLGTFLRLYAFLSQLVTFQDPDLEKLYAYGRLLLAKLPGEGGSAMALDEEVKLSYYRLQKTSEGSAALSAGDTATVSGPTSVGTGKPSEEDVVPLSEIVDVLNEKFGTDFGPEDQLLFDQVVGDLTQDEQLAAQAKSNTMNNFKLAFDPKALAAFVARIERNEDIASQFMANDQLRQVAMQWMMQQVFEQLRAQ